MNKILLVLLGLLPGILLCQEKYSRVRIYTNHEGLRKLASTGVTIDHGYYRKDTYFESDFSETEVRKINAAGIKYDLLIDNVSQHYEDQNKQEHKNQLPEISSAGCGANAPDVYPVPSNFSLGTMGGYFKYNEFLAHLDSMASKFPGLITLKQPIDTFKSIQGKDIYYLKISDNALTDENEPEIMYSALHHSREPASLSQLIFYMWYLLENYGSDPEITYLVNNTEMYFVPMVNPDGYLYNQTNNPNGGGMWRKNRRNNGGGQYGVDLNRNYGLHWGYDDAGSSPDPSTDTYRGTAGFSEPETQALKFFCENHTFKLVLNYHTYGDLFIYPWSYEENIYTPDSAYFVNYASQATRDNFYSTGTANQTVGYTANGDSDDWMYGEQSTKNKIIVATPEAGPADFGFWPASSEIISVCQSNMTQNLIMAHFALRYARVKEESPVLISSKTGYFPFTIRNFGLDTPSTFTVSIAPLGNDFDSLGLGKVFSSMNLLEEKTDSIEYALNPQTAPGTEVRFIISVDNGMYVESDTIKKIYGQPLISFSEAGNNMNNWTSQNWGISNSVYHSPSSSITDSPSGNYPNNTTRTITLSQPVDLSLAADALLTFWARWAIEPGWDFVQVLASTDNGSTWTPLCGKYTKPGNSNQDEGQPLYDGMQLTWVPEEISLKDFIGSSIKIKFQLISDIYTTYDGFYFDDLKVEIISASQEVGIDSLIINPASPAESDSINVIAFTTLPSSGCALINSSVQSNNFNIQVNAVHELGALTVLCNSTDTTSLGVLNAGNYALIYMLSDSSSNVLDIDTLFFTVDSASGINNTTSFYRDINIFPNPAAEMVFIRGLSNTNAKIEFFNPMGQRVLFLNITDNRPLDLSSLKPGIYFYRVQADQFASAVKRLVIMK